MTIHRMCDGASNLGCILVFQSTTPTVIIQKGSNDGNGNADGNADGDGNGNADQKEDTTNTMSMAEAMSLMHQLVGCNLRAVSRKP